MALADSKNWRAHVSTNLPTMDAVNVTGFFNAGKEVKIEANGAPDNMASYKTLEFWGDTVPSNTDYPDTVAPIGSVFHRLILTSGVVTGAEDYQKVAAGQWILVSSSQNGIVVVDTTITTAQLLALNATPIEIAPAPGAGKIIIPVDLQFFMDYATTAYNGIAVGEDIAIKYTDGSGAIVATCEATGFLDQASDQRRIVQAAYATAVAPVANAALVAHMLTDEIATGDSPLKVRVRYKIVDVLA